MFGDDINVKVYEHGQFKYSLKHVHGFCDDGGILMMTVGVRYFYSSQCAQNIDKIVYYRTNDRKLIKFSVDNQNSETMIDGVNDVRDFKVEINGEITVMSLNGLLKRVSADGKAEKEIQLTNTPNTHWTTFCRLGKYTCVAGHDSKNKQIVFTAISDLSTRLPTTASTACQCIVI